MRCAKEITKLDVHKGTKCIPFKVLQAGLGVMSTSPVGPSAAQAIWRVGRLSLHLDSKMLYKQREEKKIKITWRCVYQQREGEGYSVEEGNRLGMPAMMITEGGSFWHQSI